MVQLVDRVKVGVSSVASSGTGTITLGNAESGFQSFPSSLNGKEVRYVAEEGTSWEIGKGTYTHSGTTLSRGVVSSSSGTAAINLSNAAKIFVSPIAEDFVANITVTVSGGNFLIDGTANQTITIVPSVTYRLDQSDNSNSGHPLLLATSADGTTYSDGVTIVGSAGSSGSYVEVRLQQDAPAALFYKCQNHSGMGGSISQGGTSYSVGDGGLTEKNFTTALNTKLNGIESSANNYVHPNHSGEVTSTSDGATVIADNVVDEANLKVSNSPVNGYVLTAQSGNTGGLTWAAASSGGGGSATSALSEQEFTATANQTVFTVSGGITNAANVAVFLNGSKLGASDYTASASANTVTLATGATVGDLVEISEFGQEAGGASVTSSDTAPSSPSAGDLWFDSSTAELLVYYQDADSSQWVTVSGEQGPQGATGQTGAAGTSTFAALTDTPSSLSGQGGKNVQVNSAGNALEFAAAGGAMTVYSTLADLIAVSSPSAGDMAFVSENNNVYIRAASGWRKIATINESPTAVSGHSSSYPSFADNAYTDITMASTDPEGFDVTWSYAVSGNGTLSGTNINNSGGTTLASIAVQTANSNSGGTNTITYRITRQTTSVGGDFNITFTATDSQSTQTSDTGAIAFTLSFSVTNSRYTSLLMAANGTGTNSTFTDSSSSSHTITPSGDPTQGSFNPYRKGGFSLNMAGNGGLSLPSAVSSGAASGAFTWEMWVYIQSYPRDYMNFIETRASENGAGIFWGTGNGSNRGVYWFNSTAGLKNSGHHLSLNEWHHVSLCRSSSGVISMFADGNQIKTGDSYTSTVSNPMRLGDYINGNYEFEGKMTDVRILNGTELYSGSTYTVPTEALTKIANTAFLYPNTSPYRADYSDNSHAITEISGTHKIVPSGPFDYGEATVSDGGSVSLDGNDVLNVTYSNDFDFGTGDFTAELWVRPTLDNIGSYNNIFGVWNATVSGVNCNNWAIQLANTTSRNPRFVYNSGSIQIVSASDTLPLDTWSHLAYVRSGNDHKLYLNGKVTSATSTISGAHNAGTTSPLTIGARSNASVGFTGDIAFARICKGLAVYTGDFTVPTTALETTQSSSTNISSITNQCKFLFKGQGAKIFDKAQTANFNLVGNTVGSSTNKGGNWANTFSTYFDGTSDYVTVADSDLINFTSGDFTIEWWMYKTNAAMGWLFSQRDSSVLEFGIRMDDGNPVDSYSLGYANIQYDSANYQIQTDTTLNNWHHCSFNRIGNVIKFYTDGVLKDSRTEPASLVDYSDELYIASWRSNTTAFQGYIQDFRITKGLARYTANDETSNIPTAPLKG